MNLFDPIFFLLLLVSLCNTAIAWVVWRSGASRLPNRIFGLMALCVACWTFTNALFRLVPTESGALLWAQLSYGAALATAASVLHFASVYPKAGQLPAVFRPFGWIIAALLCVSVFRAGWVIEAVPLVPERSIQTGLGIYPLAAFLVGALGLALWGLARSQSQTRGVARMQARYVLFGTALTTIFGLFFNLALPLAGDYRFVWVGPTSSLLFIGFSAYSIIAHHLFDVRVLIRRTVLYAVLLAFLTGGFSVLALVLAGALQRWLGQEQPFFASLVAAVAIGLGVDPLRRFLERATDSFLFQREREEQDALLQLARRLGETVDRSEVVETLLSSLTEVMRARSGVFYLLRGHSAEGESANNALKVNWEIESKTEEGQPQEAALSAAMVKKLAAMAIGEPHQNVFNTKEQKSGLKGGASTSLLRTNLLLANSILCAFRLQKPSPLSDRKTDGVWEVGLLLLAAKRSGASYTEADEGLLEACISQGTLALQKARYFEGDQQKSEFVSIAAHELLTPITAVEGYLSLILDDHLGQVDDKAAEYLRKGQFSAARLRTLVKDLLSVSRLESGRISFTPQVLDARKLTADVVDQLHFSAQEKGLELRFSAPTQLPPAWADSDRLTQVLINLIGNAIKYTPRGSVHVSVRAEGGTHPHLVIKVTDTGLGMSKADQAKLFQKFYRVQTDQTRDIQGTGLGLYITKTLIEKMDGTIRVESQFGKGSTFTFTLPLANSTPMQKSI